MTTISRQIELPNGDHQTFELANLADLRKQVAKLYPPVADASILDKHGNVISDTAKELPEHLIVAPHPAWGGA